MRRFLNLIEAPMTREKYGFGMETMYGYDNEVALSGGIRSGSSPPGFLRLAYEAIDLLVLEKTDDRDTATIGVVELFVGKGSEIAGLVNIKINPKNRKAGVGRRIIQAVFDTAPNDLVICDITPSALGFWKKMGAEIYTSYGEPYDSKKKFTTIMGVLRKPGSTTPVTDLPFFHKPYTATSED